MKTAYIIFSATPYKMGRFIRTVLHNEYNHVSLAFEEDLSVMYSFARFHENAPLYGGFVTESPCRHVRAEDSSRIKVCRIEMEEENYLRLREFVSRMEQDGRRYIYNMYSAMLAPLHIRFLIRDSYTCAEFVGDALSIAGYQLPRGAYHSISRMQRLLQHSVIYEGSCAEHISSRRWGSDRFPERMNKFRAVTATLHSLWRLSYRAAVSLGTMMLFWELPM